MVQGHHSLSIPSELVEYIVTFLWDDPHTICQCTFVCRQWHTAIRPHLFRQITIDRVETLGKLEKLLLSDPAAAYWIRELHFQRSTLGLEDLDGRWVLDDMPGSVLPNTLKKLWAVEITDIRISQNGPTRRFIRDFSKFTTVKSLSISHCSIPDGFLLSLLAVFPHLHTLRVWDLKFSTASPNFDVIDFTLLEANCKQTRHGPGAVPHLTHFSIRDNRFKKSIGSFAALQSLRTVQSLEIYHTGIAFFHDEISRTLLPTCGPSLTYLKLTTPRLPSIGSLSKQSQCDNVSNSELSFSFSVSCHNCRILSYYQASATFFDSIGTQGLRV